MMKSTVLLVIALAAGAAYGDEPKKPPAADTKPKDAAPPKDTAAPAKDIPKDTAKDMPKDTAKDMPKDTAAPAKDASGASAEVKAGTGVEKHEIVGEATTFSPGTTVWVWSRITNGEGNVKHVWKRDGKEVWTAVLPVGSKQWTTFSRRAIPAAGSWEVDVLTESGAQLGQVSFTIQ
ncbi:MAG TPA: DUF2914 domain-containing protein [Kofleriaceae bacterium]|nr:DUF2914 domain-containing protein [Kofleriaceae bacterium]